MMQEKVPGDNDGFGEESRGKLNMNPVKIIYIFIPHERERNCVVFIYNN